MKSPGRGGGAGALLAAVTPLAGDVAPPVDFRRGRVVQGRVVLDYLVHGAPVSFEVCHDGGPGRWRIEVFARAQVDAPLVRALGLEKVGPRRFLLARATVDREGWADVVATECLGALGRLADRGPAAATVALVEALAPDRSLVVVDIGANPLDLPAYTRLLGLGACRVVGFEPQPEAFARLQGKDPARELYLPHAIGRPGTAHLNIFQASGFASTYDIDESTIELIGSDQWTRMTRLVETLDLELTALDDVPDLPAFDLLKIDVQGGELAVFESGRRALADALCVIPEVSFFPLYRDQPTFADVHQELVEQGFALHKFMFQKSVHVHGTQSLVDPLPWDDKPRSQLLDGDAVYVRDLRHLTAFSTEQLKKLVLLATFVFDSPDLGARVLDELVARDVVAATLPATYAATTYV